MEVRKLDHSETDLLAQAYHWESAFPTFYTDAGFIWTASLEEALLYYGRCVLYGVFDEGEFVGLVYMEPIGNIKHLNVHLDLKRGTKFSAEPIKRLLSEQMRAGTKSGQVWVLRQNRPLQRILCEAGFDYSGLTMRQGESHGRVMQWLQLTAERSF